MSRAKEVITVVVVSLAIAILAGEVYYRFISSIGYMTPAILKSRGLEYKPAQFARYTLPQQEQTAHGKYYVNKLGYRGRFGIFEVFVINDEARKLIYEKVPTSVLREQAREMGMRTLREDGARKVVAGLTSAEEVIRATVGDLD